MNRTLLALLLLMALMLNACSTVHDVVGRAATTVRKAFRTPQPGSISPSADTLMAWAQRAEAEHDIPLAALYVEVGRRLFPYDKTFMAYARRLEAVIAQKTEAHFTQGKQLWQQGDRQAARREFMAVLRYQPEHQPSLVYLKQRRYTQAMQSHTIQTGDTLSQLAQQYYNDPAKHTVIAYFNDMQAETVLLPGRRLDIPVLEHVPPKPPLNVARKLKQAQRDLKAGRYGEVVGAAGQILTYDYLNKEAMALRNQAYLQMGLHLSRQARQVDALRMLGHVEPQYDGLAEAQASVLGRVHKEIEALLAASRWEEIDHTLAQVKKYLPAGANLDDWVQKTQLQRAESLRKAKQYPEALAVLQVLDTENTEVSEQIVRLRRDMDKEAERQYVIGVKYYLKENLQLAIKAWERTLRLKPDHPKAARDIANARSLLEKLDTVE